MADRRMFSKKITDSDAFIEMSSSTQSLYFHLNQSADDDGFNNQIQIAMMKAHASVDDLKVLMMKNFVIRFENGLIVIKHWRMHNTLRKDRYAPTSFQDELAQLDIKPNQSYTLKDDGCQVVAKRLPQDSIGKVSIGKVSIEDVMPSTDKSAPVPSVIEISLNDKSMYPITQPDVDKWAKLYPAVDIMSELRKMVGWCDANPAKRKTKAGINRFINSWLAREQDRGGNKPIQAQHAQPTQGINTGEYV